MQPFLANLLAERGGFAWCRMLSCDCLLGTMQYCTCVGLSEFMRLC
jgi:hypothetical protein